MTYLPMPPAGYTWWIRPDGSFQLVRLNMESVREMLDRALRELERRAEEEK